MKTSKQLKDLINNKAKESNINPQLLMTRFFMERFLERISISKYKNNFVLKGGVLISSIVGVDLRMTKDMDLTIQKLPLNGESLKLILEEIISVKLDDAAKFTLLDIKPIQEEAHYHGFKVRFNIEFDKSKNVIQVDITTGDAITPKASDYTYKLLLEKRSIEIISYPIETVLAEKIETILSRSIVNTRMRDFYDCYTLFKLYENTINIKMLNTALKNTAETRNSEHIFTSIDKNFSMIQSDTSIQESWKKYSNEYSYANNISFDDLILTTRSLLEKIGVLKIQVENNGKNQQEKNIQLTTKIKAILNLCDEMKKEIGRSATGLITHTSNSNKAFQAKFNEIYNLCNLKGTKYETLMRPYWLTNSNGYLIVEEIDMIISIINLIEKDYYKKD